MDVMNIDFGKRRLPADFTLSLFLVLCSGLFIILLVPSIAFSDRVMEGLWLGPVDAQAGAIVSINNDYLKNIGGENEVAKVEKGPKEGDKFDKLAWEVKKANMADQFDIDGLWGDKSNHTAYFYIYIKADKDLGGVDLWLGSDDTLKVWLNGKVVHTHAANRGITVDSDKIQIELKKGWNALMAKIGETGGGWRFSINFPNQPKEITLSTKKPAIQAVEPDRKMTTTWATIKA